MLNLELPDINKHFRGEFTYEQVNSLRNFGIDAETCIINELISQVFQKGWASDDHYWYLYKTHPRPGIVRYTLQNYKRISRRKIRKGLIILKQLKKAGA